MKPTRDEVYGLLRERRRSSNVNTDSLHPILAYRLYLMFKAVKNGGNWGFTSAVRTYAQQKHLYDGYVRGLPGFNLAANPDNRHGRNFEGVLLQGSNHQESSDDNFGRAVDMDDDPSVGWRPLHAALPGYGLALTVPGEPWHWSASNMSRWFPGPFPEPGFRTLKRGMVGDDVKTLQAQLKGAGIEIALDGHWGPATDEIVKDYQRKLGATPDGLWGPSSQAAFTSGGTIRQASVTEHLDADSAIQSTFGNKDYTPKYVDTEWIVLYRPLKDAQDHNFHAMDRVAKKRKAEKLRFGDPGVNYPWVGVARQADGFHVTLREGAQNFHTKLWPLGGGGGGAGPKAPSKGIAGLTKETLAQIMPAATKANIDLYFDPLITAMTKYEINTKLRVAHFLAQIGHESGSFKWPEEIADGSAYEGRSDLGNTQPGDGKRFKGRGLIQLTGRHNYTRYSNETGVDYVAEPTKVATDPYVGVDVACWYWKSRNLNAFADADDVEKVTRGVNGGLNGFEDRKAYLQRAKKALRL